MDKKLQVFISSTFTDMQEERQAAVEAILKCGHIPAGMELFSADNKKQFEVIKTWIKNSDVFLLILGGRYGSIEASSNKSYIQLEYEYAKHIGKKPIAIVLSDKGIASKATEGIYDIYNLEANTPEYKKFKDNIIASKMCEFFDNKASLKSCIFSMLRNCEENINQYHGWIRGEKDINTYTYPYIIKSQEFIFRYINKNDILYTKKIKIKALVDGIQYFSDRYMWNSGGNITQSLSNPRQIIVDEFMEGAFKVYTIRLEDISFKGREYEIEVHFKITNSTFRNHQYLGVTISYPSEQLHLQVDTPSNLTLSHCKYNIYKHSVDRVPEATKKLTPNNNHIQKTFTILEIGKKYNLEWDIN
jgi:hypothetical protein